MKTSRGISFIEVVTALAIVSILLPVVGIVFYNLFVTPPDQGARLTINNEISLLSSMLSNDAHLAENFTAGTFPLSPYYGNFTWTDYSVTPSQQYIVSYYATCPNVSNTSCVNNIARTVNRTNTSATPTPIPTPTPTPSPVPTPTPTPSTITYTFCSGGGTDKWAWSKAFTNAEWCPPNHGCVGTTHPSSPADFFSASGHTPPYSIYGGNSSIYSWVCSNDSSSWRSLDTTAALEYGADTEMYVFQVLQTGVTNISVTWIGHGITGGFGSTYHTLLQIWNYQNTMWYNLVDRISTNGSQVNNIYINNITTNPSYFIEPGTGNVSILASAVTNSIPADMGIFTDYIAIKVNGSAPGPTPTPVPTPAPPATQTYTYCSGGGTNLWAWAKAWNNSEWFTQGRPTTPDNFFDPSAYNVADADASSYISICTANDSNSWSNRDTTPPVDYGVNSQLYTIPIAQDRLSVSNLSINWRGYGGAFTQNTKVRIWNYSASSWYTLPSINLSDPVSKTINTYINNITTAPSNYIQTGTGYVTLLASSDTDNRTAQNTDFGTALYFNGSNSSSVTASSSVPTDTFTFEAWVRAIEEHEIDTEATSGISGISGQHYVFWPTHGGEATGNAGVGLSVGTNGISVYEHGGGYLPALAVYEGNLGTAWNHIAVVYSSDVANIYLNGNLVETGSTSTKGIAYAPCQIGYGYDWGSGSSCFNGSIDEVRVWNVVRTQSEIRNYMYQEITSPTANLTGYWKFNNCSTDVVDGIMEDSSTYNNDGTLSAPPPQCTDSLDRDVTVNTDYIALTVICPTPTPTPTATVVPTPTPSPVIVSFTTSTSWTPPAGAMSVEVLVVGGGGGGGGVAGWVYQCGGAGGAGGVVYNPSYAVTPGTPITVTVGAGGDGRTNQNNGYSGANSVFGSITAYGGGGGGTLAGVAGGSGGGGGGRTTVETKYAGGDADYISPRQGYDGGNGNSDSVCCVYTEVSSGGGGGAGGVGGTASDFNAGNGGPGVAYDGIFGNVGGLGNGQFAGGGGGACYGDKGTATHGGGAGARNGDAEGDDAVDGTGGGGGGSYSPALANYGGDGGNGFVCIKYTIGYTTLTVSSGAGGNVTTPTPPGANYVAGTGASIVAVAGPCYQFVNWTGDTGTIANVNAASTTITMNSNYTIQANFALSGNKSLSLNASPSAGGAPFFNGSNPFTCGFDVPIHANPAEGYYFQYWTGIPVPTGIANANASDTTVQMTVNRSLTAVYGVLPVPSPTATPINYLTTMYLTWHITANNFSLSPSTGTNLITANMTAGVRTSMGKYVQKQLTLYLQTRPLYLLPEENIWGDDSVSTLSSFLMSGDYNTISGDVKVNGTVTVDAGALANVIDGNLYCPMIIGDNPARLSYTSRTNGSPRNTMPDIGTMQSYFTTNLSAGVQVLDDVLHEYVFTGNGTTYLHSVNQVWQGNNPETNHTLKPGTYYSPGTIQLDDTYTKGSVTFIANKIVINNDNAGGLITPKITLGPFQEDLLFWANASGDNAILIQGTSIWHACASFEGVLFAPNGEIDLQGSGRMTTGYIDAAELYNGALVAKDLTISGSRWNFYRW